MADVTAASSGAPVLARARLKLDIYKTGDGNIGLVIYNIQKLEH